jgi:hypothetical protein
VRTLADDLLEGAIDLHAHIHPQLRLEEPGRVLDHEWARAARSAEMRGFAMKSHLWPTMGQARILSELFPGTAALGTVTLNGNVGGLCPFTAESAVMLGARCIWMPPSRRPTISGSAPTPRASPPPSAPLLLGAAAPEG